MTRAFLTPTQLPYLLHRQLNLYAVAAGAAGVGVLALAATAEAKIVYTPTHERIVPYTPLPLDLNHDGITDFYFINGAATATSFSGSTLLVTPGSTFHTSSPNRVWGKNHLSASALQAGVTLKSGKAFRKGDRFMARAWTYFDRHTTRFEFPWANDGKGVKNRYLGLEFRIKGKAHFGWARLTVDMTPRPSGTLTGYAYETVPGKPIIAGKTKGQDVITVQPGSLGHLAAGRK